MTHSELNNALYTYKAKIVRIYDADTVYADIDFGMKFWTKEEPLRIARIDAPEVRGSERPEGIVARDMLTEMILGKEVIISTDKDKKGKYGRYIAEIYMDHEGECINISDWLVSQGLAKYEDY